MEDSAAFSSCYIESMSMGRLSTILDRHLSFLTVLIHRAAIEDKHRAIR